MSTHKTSTIDFTVKPLYNQIQPNSLRILMQRYSFWIATLSIFSFVLGNLVGQHGWYTVYRSVLGSGLEQQIVYTGTVPPIQNVPDYVAWSRYGGDPHDNTYRQVPSSVLVPLPSYNSTRQSNHRHDSAIGQIYSVGFAGSYATGGDGDGYHAGVDIRVPIGTPIHSIANGIVYRTGYLNGFGNTIVVKHPNVPDPSYPNRKTTLYSVYAHLSSIHVREKDLVEINSVIGLSGNTGNSTGPHLHFQIDKDTAPWHPYWPEGNKQELVYKHMVSPMLYVQSNYKPVIVNRNQESVIARTERSTNRTAVSGTAYTQRIATTTNTSRLLSLREERLRARLRDNAVIAATTPKQTVTLEKPTVLGESVQVSAGQEVVSVEIKHDREFKIGVPEMIRIVLKDADGNTVSRPKLDRGVYLKTAYGTAKFNISILQDEDFTDGQAIVEMTTDSGRTVVIQAQPFGTLSKPLTLER